MRKSYSIRGSFLWNDTAFQDDNYVAEKIIELWDPFNAGYTSIDKLCYHAGFHRDFVFSLARAIQKSSFLITVDDLSAFLKTLREGTTEQRLDILLAFADKDGNGLIILEKTQVQLIENLAKKIGIEIVLNQNDSMITIDTNSIKLLFNNSIEGSHAITFFCSQIFKTLTKKIQNRPKLLSTVANVSFVSNNLSQRISNYFRFISTPILFKIILLLLQIGLFLWVFLTIYLIEKLPVAFAIAHGFGINLRIITLFQYASMARTLMALLSRNTILRNFIPLGFNIDLHSYCGLCLFINAIGHTIGHIILAEQLLPQGFYFRFIQPCVIRASPSEHCVNGDGITGAILLGLIIAFGITGMLRSFSSFAYIRFISIHYLHLVWPIFILLHVPYDTPYMLFVIALFVGERLFDFYYLTTHSTLATSRPGSNGITFVSVERISPSVAGTYYRIKVPAISLWEWHPFSIAGGTSSDYLTFFIDSVGDWTTKLHELASSPERKNYSIQIQGPFLAPASYALRDKPILAVASGIGITPFFSVISEHVQAQQVLEYDNKVFSDMFSEERFTNNSNNENTAAGFEEYSKKGSSSTELLIIKSLRKVLSSHDDDIETATTNNVTTTELIPKGRPMLHVLWCIREPNELLFYFEYIRNLLKEQDRLLMHKVEVDIYLTGIGEDPNHMLSQTLFLLSLCNRNHKYMRVHFGRPDIPTFIKSKELKECYYCGGPGLGEILRLICFEKGIKYSAEDFDEGGTIVKSFLTYMEERKKKKLLVTSTTEEEKQREGSMKLMSRRVSNVKTMGRRKSHALSASGERDGEEQQERLHHIQILFESTSIQNTNQMTTERQTSEQNLSMCVLPQQEKLDL